MDRIDSSPSTPDSSNVPASRRTGSQRRVPQVLYWVLAAAIVLRVVTAMADRGRVSETAGLVAWQSPGNVLSLSAASRRPVLYDFTAAWCPPCRRLDSEGWADDAVAAEVGNSFIPARIVDREREDGKNTAAIVDLHRRYSIQVFPTLVAADSTGREIARMEGYAGRQSLDAFLKEAIQKAKSAPGR